LQLTSNVESVRALERSFALDRLFANFEA